MTAKENPVEAVKAVYPNAWYYRREGLVMAGTSPDQDLGQSWIDAASKLPTPIPTTASETDYSYLYPQLPRLRDELEKMWHGAKDEHRAWLYRDSLRSVMELIRLSTPPSTEESGEPLAPASKIPAPVVEDKTWWCVACGKHRIITETVAIGTAIFCRNCDSVIGHIEPNPDPQDEPVDPIEQICMMLAWQDDYTEEFKRKCISDALVWEKATEISNEQVEESADYLRGKLDEGFNEGVEAAALAVRNNFDLSQDEYEWRILNLKRTSDRSEQ